MPGHNSQPYARFPGHGCMDDLATERTFNFDSQATLVIDVLGLFF